MGTQDAPGSPGHRLSESLIEAALRLAGAEHRAAPGEETDFPAVDIFETAAEIVVEIELPGVDPGRVAAFVDRGALVIEGVKEEDAPPGRVAFLCMERSFGTFRRVVPLLGAVDLARATALCRAGVLRIRLPKIEDKRGRRIAIPIAAEPGP